MIHNILSQNIFKKISEYTKKNTANSDSAHDYSHSLRVLSNAAKINSVENGDLQVLIAASFLHDICNYPKNHPDRKLSSTHSAQQAAEFLLEIGFDKSKLELVKDAILCHSFSANFMPQTLEGKIFQDADRLDSIGAIGIARAFVTGAKFNAKLYNEVDPFCKNDRQPNDKQNTLDHFKIKLFKLVDTMLTPTGKQLGQERTKFMSEFVKQLENEFSDETKK